MMQGRTIALILGAVLLSAMGQLFLKAGARHLARLDELEFLFAAARDMRVVAGLAAWVASTVCWLLVLRVTPLSRAYGVSSLTYLLVPLASAYLLDERLPRLHAAGTTLIVVGVACLLFGD